MQVWPRRRYRTGSGDPAPPTSSAPSRHQWPPLTCCIATSASSNNIFARDYVSSQWKTGERHRDRRATGFRSPTQITRDGSVLRCRMTTSGSATLVVPSLRRISRVCVPLRPGSNPVSRPSQATPPSPTTRSVPPRIPTSSSTRPCSGSTTTTAARTTFRRLSMQLTPMNRSGRYAGRRRSPPGLEPLQPTRPGRRQMVWRNRKELLRQDHSSPGTARYSACSMKRLLTVTTGSRAYRRAVYRSPVGGSTAPPPGTTAPQLSQSSRDSVGSRFQRHRPRSPRRCSTIHDVARDAGGCTRRRSRGVRRHYRRRASAWAAGVIAAGIARSHCAEEPQPICWSRRHYRIERQLLC